MFPDPCDFMVLIANSKKKNLKSCLKYIEDRLNAQFFLLEIGNSWAQVFNNITNNKLKTKSAAMIQHEFTYQHLLLDNTVFLI